MPQRHPILYADLSALNPVFRDVRVRPVPTDLMIDGRDWIQLLEGHSDRLLLGPDNYATQAHLRTAAPSAYVRDEVLRQLWAEAIEAIAHGNAQRPYSIAPLP